jgi:methylmalonyl-CoA/ethylmalonyl-CoA epimerase
LFYDLGAENQAFSVNKVPAVRYIFCAEPRHKSMPLPSGLKRNNSSFLKQFRKKTKHHKMRKIEHIGIAVKNLEVSNLLFEKLFGAPSYKQEEVASEGVKTSFFMNGPNKIELLEATNPESPIAKFLEKKGEGIHHIAFDVEDILSEIDRLKSEGFTVLNETPKKGADNKLVAFLHPKGTNGVLIELCQEIK